jgi:hypothetical protein
LEAAGRNFPRFYPLPLVWFLFKGFPGTGMIEHNDCFKVTNLMILERTAAPHTAPHRNRAWCKLQVRGRAKNGAHCAEQALA